MGKYNKKADEGVGAASDLVAANALLWIANELAEANRLKILELGWLFGHKAGSKKALEDRA